MPHDIYKVAKNKTRLWFGGKIIWTRHFRNPDGYIQDKRVWSLNIYIYTV